MMRCKGNLHRPPLERDTGDKALRKKVITEARRDQNRRAQRAFRDRRRAKERPPESTGPRLLAPHPPEGNLDVIVKTFDDEILDLNHILSGEETPPVRSPNQHSKLQAPQKTISFKTEKARFTFSSPQTLFPAHESFVPNSRTPYSELLDLVKNGLRAALWPHGVTATLAACLFNARRLGIDIDRTMEPNYMSPFYRPSSSLSYSPGSIVELTDTDVLSKSQSAELDFLRPCLAQVMFPHHACLDLLPLPRLRETAVMISVRLRQEGDTLMSAGIDAVQELKRDVYVMQGVRFRGRGELVGGEHVFSSESARHCGHPWESGSWAVAPWFARKWKYLVDI